MNLPLPEFLCLADAPYSWLACFTFPDGTKWINRPDCGHLISSLEDKSDGHILWTLTPNPSTGITRLKGPANSEILHLKLYTLTGTVAARFILPVHVGEGEFDVSLIPEGWYLLEISNPHGLQQARIPLIKS
jgi:hypothetical protein